MANFKLNQTGEQIQADLNLLDSNSATQGQVLTANGTGGASWQNASGGGSGSGHCPDVNLGFSNKYTITTSSNMGAINVAVLCMGMTGYQYTGTEYKTIDINNGYGWYRSADGIESSTTFRKADAFIMFKSGCTVNTPNNVSKNGVRLTSNNLELGVLYLVHGNININYTD